MESIDMTLKSNNVNVIVGENIIIGEQTSVLTKCDFGGKLPSSLPRHSIY